jgi:hypothetical protein
MEVTNVVFAPGLLVVGPYRVEYSREDPSALNTEKAGCASSPLGNPFVGQPSYPLDVVGQAKLVGGLLLHSVSFIGADALLPAT